MVRIRFTKMLLFILIISILCACNNGIEVEEPIDYSILTSEKTAPENFRYIEVSETNGLSSNMSAEIVQSEAELDEAWARYSFEEEQPAILFEEQSVLLLTNFESSSCEKEIGAIGKAPDTNNIEIHFPVIEKACTDDASPRAFALAIDNTIIEEAQNIAVIEGNWEVIIKISH
ncbi:hypothetical protein [Jeotgalibacillus salarius]|uniref:Uncharacterized protein n=1 Tax=Jeotgalibacillus salarius TaxID=546023 RepID=A0A4Y8LLX6_9BACL|nr:hypothetical protein [Jeotgalibacillus salarius]TFE04042.1 hypothetical protein E2626_01560 [Jeotgalibacillus salarius]